jgi:hypothetical protein
MRAYPVQVWVLLGSRILEEHGGVFGPVTSFPLPSSIAPDEFGEPFMQTNTPRGPLVTNTGFAASASPGGSPSSTLQLPALRRAASLGSADFSRGIYRVGGNTNGLGASSFPYGQAGEFLQALPMLKIDAAYLQLGGNPSTGPQVMATAIYRMQRNSTAITAAYDNL